MFNFFDIDIKRLRRSLKTGYKLEFNESNVLMRALR